METAIQVVWWIGIVGALALTLVILKEVALVIRALQGIETLAKRTHHAAGGIAANLQPARQLPSADAPALATRDAATAIARAAGAMNAQLAALAPDAGEG